MINQHSNQNIIPVNRKKKTWIWGCSIGLTITCLFLALAGLFIYSNIFAENNPLVGKIVSPQDIKVGDEFELQIEISNPTNKSVFIRHILIQPTHIGEGQNPPKIWEGAEAIGSKPEMKLDIYDSGSIQYSYLREIDPGKSETIILRMKAINQGAFEGDIVFYTNNWVNIHAIYFYDVKIEITQ